jgi:hypothetical protein
MRDDLKPPPEVVDEDRKLMDEYLKQWERAMEEGMREDEGDKPAKKP